MRIAMVATMIATIGLVQLPVVAKADCLQEFLKIGGQNGVDLKDRYCLRNQVQIREVDASSSSVDWGTTCDVVLQPLSVSMAEPDCPPGNPLMIGDTLQVISLQPGSYGLVLKRNGSSLTGTKSVLLQAKKAAGSNSVLWLASQSAMMLGGKSYDVRVYFVDESASTASPSDIEKHYRIELFDLGTSCTKYEPEYSVPVKVTPPDRCPRLPKEVRFLETQVGEGKEHRSN